MPQDPNDDVAKVLIIGEVPSRTMLQDVVRKLGLAIILEAATQQPAVTARRCGRVGFQNLLVVIVLDAPLGDGVSCRFGNAYGVILASPGSSWRSASALLSASQSHTTTKCVFVFILARSRPYASS